MDKQKEQIEIINNEQIKKIRENVERVAVRGIRATGSLKAYLAQFVFRLFIFVTILIFYLTGRDRMTELMVTPFYKDLSIIHVVWAIFMVTMITHLFPSTKISMAVRKIKETEYKPVENYSDHSLLKFLQKQNISAWMVMLVWFFFNGIMGVLYISGVLQQSDLLMLTVFYYLSDFICILFFCPFQTFIMKNKCCINCRIYDWGHFMMFTPMIFITNFYSLSLIFTATIVLIHWEIQYNMHPERFWEGSNKTLKCENCKEQTCYLKKKLSAPVKERSKEHVS